MSKFIYLRTRIRWSMALSLISETRPHLLHCICMYVCFPGITSYCVALFPRCLSMACRICAVMNNSSELYTVATDMRSAAQAFASCSAVNKGGSIHACSKTISRTRDLRMLRALMYSFNLSSAASYVFCPFTAV